MLTAIVQGRAIVPQQVLFERERRRLIGWQRIWWESAIKSAGWCLTAGTQWRNGQEDVEEEVVPREPLGQWVILATLRGTEWAWCWDRFHRLVPAQETHWDEETKSFLLQSLSSSLYWQTFRASWQKKKYLKGPRSIFAQQSKRVNLELNLELNWDPAQKLTLWLSIREPIKND